MSPINSSNAALKDSGQDGAPGLIDQSYDYLAPEHRSFITKMAAHISTEDCLGISAMLSMTAREQNVGLKLRDVSEYFIANYCLPADSGSQVKKSRDKEQRKLERANRLIHGLYEGAIQFLLRALDNPSDHESFRTNVRKSSAIIKNFRETLDFEKGGNIAADLDRLYDFLLRHLTAARKQRRVSHLRKIIGIIHTVFSGYRDIDSESMRIKKFVASKK